MLGAVLFAAGVLMALRSRRFMAGALRAEGTVVRHVMGGTENTVHFPVVRFQTHDGQAVESRSPVGTTPLLFPVGKRVLVSYDPQAPERIQVHSRVLRWAFPLILMGMGVATTLMGAGFWLAHALIGGLPGR